VRVLGCLVVAHQRKATSLDGDDWEEQLEKMPVFMNSSPTQEEIDASPDLQALQALVHEDTTPAGLCSWRDRF
jgi:hypothetical protein